MAYYISNDAIKTKKRKTKKIKLVIMNPFFLCQLIFINFYFDHLVLPFIICLSSFVLSVVIISTTMIMNVYINTLTGIIKNNQCYKNPHNSEFLMHY